MKSISSIAAALLTLPLTALAGVGSWSGSGPFATGAGNRVITAMAVAPDGTIYAGTDSGTVFSFQYPPPPSATLTVTITGSGTITSQNQIGANYSCNTTGACTPAAFTYGDSVTLSATGSNSTFSGWSGNITGSANPYTNLVMDGDKAVTATFTANPALAQISGSATVYYTLISALADCATDAVILARDTVFSGGLTITGYTITLKGGFPDATFSGARSGYSTIGDNLTITGGTLIADQLEVGP